MVEGRVNVPEKSLLQNALSAIILSPLGKWSSPFKLLSIKAEDPILERPSCSVRVPLKPHLSNAELGTDDTPWGISIEPVRFHSERMRIVLSLLILTEVSVLHINLDSH